MNAQPETHFARGPDGRVGYQVFGEGPIDLLFAPPWVWNIDVMWEEPRIERFFRRLSSFCRVIIFDTRGTGVSDLVPLGALPTLEEWADDIRIVMDAAGCREAAIVGASEAVPLAVVFSATHPKRVKALILVEGFASGLRKDDYPAGLPAELLDGAREWVTRDDYLLLTAPSAANDHEFLRWLDRFRRLAMPPSALEDMFINGFHWDVRAVLPTIAQPTLVIHRSGDRYMRIGHGRYVADRIPGANLVELPGDDHLFFMGDQDAILDEIQAFLTGVRGSPDTDRVLATVLFTDIVGSTDRASALGDRRWRETLDEHDRIVQSSIEHFRGRGIKTTGDGVLATFDGPARAIRCAASMRGEVQQRLGIEMRAGLHTGEVELRGEDVGGIAVHIGARVSAQAGAGEILVSSTVKDLVVGSGIGFSDRGMHRLKGVPDEWHLYAVTNS